MSNRNSSRTVSKSPACSSTESGRSIPRHQHRPLREKNREKITPNRIFRLFDRQDLRLDVSAGAVDERRLLLPGVPRDLHPVPKDLGQDEAQFLRTEPKIGLGIVAERGQTVVRVPLDRQFRDDNPCRPPPIGQSGFLMVMPRTILVQKSIVCFGFSYLRK